MARCLIGFFVILAFMLVAPLAAEAQPAGNVARICYLSGTSLSAAALNHERFRQGLREFGYVDGQNFVIEFCSVEKIRAHTTQSSPTQGVYHRRDLSPEPLAPPSQCAGANSPSCGSGTATHVSVDGARSAQRQRILDSGDPRRGRWPAVARGTLWRGVLGAQCPSRESGDSQPRSTIRDRCYCRTWVRRGRADLETVHHGSAHYPAIL